MIQSKSKPNVSIRINPDIIHQARVAAVYAKKTLGQWLEEAIIEKLRREIK
jgi:predicted HicB family RNase H-like nuclease